MNRMKVMALLLAVTAAVTTAPYANIAALPVYATEAASLSNAATSAINEESGASTTSSSDDDEAEDGDDAVYQNGSIDTKDTSAYEMVEIKTIEDLRDLADRCHRDAWSQDKHVILQADLILTGEDAALLIPTFGGIFDGNGHTISGLLVSEDEADRGLFGTIQESGLIQDLTVKGSIMPSGTQSRLGGIAGTNYGRITNCTFQGTIDANAEIGGIVGRNKLSGEVTGCSTKGTVTGSSYTGGIVGYNEGEISDCESRMDVNTDYTDTPISTDELSNTIANIFLTGEINSTENISARTDTGGIAGFSSGILSACKNAGNVGYDHVGYNTGGVAGRSSGLINGCRNTGKVLGRKDVGGICGQLTPYLQLDFEEGVLDELSDKLDALDDMVDTALDNTQSYSNDASDRLKRISALTGDAKDSTKIITDNAEDSLDEATDKINNATTTLQNSMSKISNVTGDIADYADDVLDSFDDLSGSIEDFLDSLDLTDEERSQARSIISSMSSDIASIKKDIQEIKSIIQGGSSSIQQNSATIIADLKDIQQKSSDLYDNASELKGILRNAGAWDDFAAKDQIEDLLDDTAALKSQAAAMQQLMESIQNGSVKDDLSGVFKDWTDGAGSNEDYQAIADKASATAEAITEYLESGALDEDSDEYKQLASLAESLKSGGSDIDSNLDGIEDIIAGTPEDIQNSMQALQKALQDMKSSKEDLYSQIQSAGDLLGKLSDHYGDLDWDDLSGSFDDLKDTLNDAPDIADTLQSALDSIASLDLHINGISDSTKAAGDDLYSSMSSLLDEMDALNDSVNGNMDSSFDELRSISAQINDIADLFNDAVNDVTDDTDPEDRIEDVSTEDIDSATQGRLTSCTNTGVVDADNNVGGIAGTMGLEYDLDPEKDIQKFGDRTLDYAFRVRCIVDRCENLGKVEVMNNYGGGVVGHMEMGVVAMSEDYGNVVSEGNYTGGVVGYSVGTVQDSYAKADLSGEKYIGGIAGYAETLYDNIAMVNVTDAEQYVGAIAGKVKELDKAEVSGNIYVSEEIYGIDGISYQGIAEGVSYEDAVSRSSIPLRFNTLRLIFTVNDTFIQEIDCNYGDAIDASAIPEVPFKDGFHGEWSRTNYDCIVADETIEAVYTRINTLLSGEQQRESGKPVILVSGDFAEDDALLVAADADNTSDKETWSVSIPEDGLETHEIRYLPVSEDPDSVTIYVVKDGHRDRVETSEMGKYVTFEASGSELTFTAQTESTAAQVRHYVLLGGAAAACIAVLGVGHAGLNRARKRRREENRQRNRHHRASE